MTFSPVSRVAVLLGWFPANSSSKDVCTRFDEVCVIVKNPPWITKCLNRNSTNDQYVEYVYGTVVKKGFSHLAFRATLRQAPECFIIDLANGQYGHFDTVIPLEKYLAERVEKVSNVNPFGTYDETIGAVNEANSRYFDRAQFNALRMDSLLQAWLGEQQLTSKSLIGLGKASFKDKLAQLQHYASAGLAATADASIQCGNLLVNLAHARDPKEEGKMLRRRMNLLKAAGITVDMMQQENRRWFRC